jgi:hypothetical protein
MLTDDYTYYRGYRLVITADGTEIWHGGDRIDFVHGPITAAMNTIDDWMNAR